MKAADLKKAILSRKFSILTIISLLAIVGVLYVQKQDYQYTLLYQYQSIPHIELSNTLNETQGGLTGRVSGFVKFDNIENQPKGLSQYVIIKPSNTLDKDQAQYFTLEEIVAMQYLSPKSLGVSVLVETERTNQAITLKDEHGNLYFIDRVTKEVSMKDMTGDSSSLITNDLAFKDFMVNFLKKID